MFKGKCGPAGLRKPGKPSHVGNRMIDSNRTANKPMGATWYPRALWLRPKKHVINQYGYLYETHQS
jgi:hypothetical protein